ncbi:hypothetical protein GCM10011506_37390 [Marivirga lumbricoides]|uniref:Anti-sigma factor n=1 Tax=Marivirga lumbricoides TaxID=1046115 RepID=A0ABQ1MWC1_9BACT|nr:hypothetical protein GCM10011506_37390 [Marivirga lumbricoides]
MKTEDWKEKLMDYLYDEMDEQEKIAFELELAKNATLREELQNLQGTRNIAGRWEDETISAPPFFQVHKNESNKTQPGGLKWFMAIAASILLLIVAAKFSELQISNSGGAFKIAFGKEISNDKTLAASEVDSLISSALAGYEEKLQKQRKEDFQSYLAASKNDNRKIITDYLTALETSNAAMMQAYWKESTQQQEVYLKTLLSDFAAYMEQQRENDMDYLIAKMELMESDKDLFKLETGQIINSLANNNTQETAY